jgi:NADH:ubiquinone oxidoreductase subunit 6 (subunit J)
MIFSILLPGLLGILGIYWLLPRPRPFPVWWGASASGIALLLAGATLIRSGTTLPENLLFYCFSVLAIIFGVLLITQRNPVHAALSFAMVVLSVCGLFLLQAAPFLMAATIIVYAGAIVVTFLFVIMLAQQAGWSDADHRSREPLISTIAGFVLVGALLYVLERTYDTQHLDHLLNQVTAASESGSLAELNSSLGKDEEFLADLQHEMENLSASPQKNAFYDDLTDIRAGWKMWKDTEDLKQMKSKLELIAKHGAEVRNQVGTLRPRPATQKEMSVFSVPEKDAPVPENVAPLGLALFTDFLLPVELGGTLLLVATIGAIAITSRKSQEPRTKSQ